MKFQGDVAMDEDELIEFTKVLSLQTDTAAEIEDSDSSDFGSSFESLTDSDSDANIYPPIINVEPTNDLLSRVTHTTKKKYWDSNEPVISLAHNATLKTATYYTSLKNLISSALSTAITTTKTTYYVAKTSVSTMSAGTIFLVSPFLRLTIVPAFNGVEHVFVQLTDPKFTSAANNAIEQSLHLLPYKIGDNLAIPMLNTARRSLRASWNLALMPIPSPDSVVTVTVRSYDGFKWLCGVTAREAFFYLSVVDQSIHRTLTRAQWKVSGCRKVRSSLRNCYTIMATSTP